MAAIYFDLYHFPYFFLNFFNDFLCEVKKSKLSAESARRTRTGKMSRIWPKLVLDAIVLLVGNLQIRMSTFGILCKRIICKSNLDIMFLERSVNVD